MSENLWQSASYRNGYGTVRVSVANVVRSTDRRLCVRLRISEDFGSQRGYARSWGVRPEHRTVLYWCDADVPSPASRFVRELLDECE